MGAVRDHGAMPEALHERYDRDEQRLVATASQELWTDALLDVIVDIAAPILESASWRGVPKHAAPLWSERSTAMLSLAAMGLRATRTCALTVRAGYAAEAQADLRRLHEAAGHARLVALDNRAVRRELAPRAREGRETPRRLRLSKSRR